MVVLCCPNQEVVAQTPSRGEGRSPLKYIISILLLDFEYFIEKCLASDKNLGFHS